MSSAATTITFGAQSQSIPCWTQLSFRRRRRRGRRSATTIELKHTTTSHRFEAGQLAVAQLRPGVAGKPPQLLLGPGMASGLGASLGLLWRADVRSMAVSSCRVLIIVVCRRAGELRAHAWARALAEFWRAADAANLLNNLKSFRLAATNLHSRAGETNGGREKQQLSSREPKRGRKATLFTTTARSSARLLLGLQLCWPNKGRSWERGDLLSSLAPPPPTRRN